MRTRFGNLSAGGAVGSGRWSGATLTEVLMSLLIMGVGLTSTISLFPISILSSIRATQMTNARLLEQNVIELIRTHPQLVEGFEHWHPSSVYAAVPANPNEIEPDPLILRRVVPRPAPGRLLSSTNLWYQASLGLPPPPLVSGPAEPRWQAGSVPDRNIQWDFRRFPAYPPDVAAGVPDPHRRSVYVVDPLGCWVNSDSTWDYGNPSPSTRFGVLLNGASGSLWRHHANLSAAYAENLFRLQDGWTTILETVPSAVSDTSVDIANQTVDLSNTAGGRLTVISADGALSATRSIQVGGGPPFAMTPPLPTALDDIAKVGRVRIQQPDHRYSYFLTVIRKPDGTARVYCPVIFNRSFSLDDERIYSATMTGDQIRIEDDLFAVNPKPLLKPNGFVMDANNGHWYRIVDVPSSPLVAPDNRTITIDRTVEVEAAAGAGNVIFLPGVVNVFHFEL